MTSLFRSPAGVISETSAEDRIMMVKTRFIQKALTSSARVEKRKVGRQMSAYPHAQMLPSELGGGRASDDALRK